MAWEEKNIEPLVARYNETNNVRANNIPTDYDELMKRHQVASSIIEGLFTVYLFNMRIPDTDNYMHFIESQLKKE